MRLSGQFRERATQCLRLADGAMALEIRRYWTEMAQLWHNLATHLEETHRASENSSVFPPLVDGQCPEDVPGR